ncbi:MAG: helix-turn-helix domain-containing protein, partial [candidate division Zixibacteria bacterium]
YNWPGNVRELSQLIERVTFLSKGATIGVADINLPQTPASSASIDMKSGVQIKIPDEGLSLEEIEKEIILSTLRSCGGNISEAARKLRIGREALRYRIKKYAIMKMINITG